MKSVLFVDDDPLVLRIYRDSLTRHGLSIITATDGLEAMKALRAAPPDLVVLDLMMPKLTGVDVLKFIRGQPDLAALPVIVLSNSYMDEQAGQAAALGIQEKLLKAGCTPAMLLDSINGLLENTAAGGQPASPGSPELTQAAPEDFESCARNEFIASAPATRAALQQLTQALARAANGSERGLRLRDLFRKVHFLTTAAGMNGYPLLSQMTSVLEALLFQLMDQPGLLTPSILRTLGQAVDFLGRLFSQPGGPSTDVAPAVQVLVVDDDPLSAHLALSAVRRVQLEARTVADPLTALEWLRERRYDLLLLDVEMPGLDGFELCGRIRALPGYQNTPVIFVTAHASFDSRAKGLVSGADDLIGKPFLPLELAVKVVMLLLASRAG